MSITASELAELAELRAENARLKADAELFCGLRKLVREVLVRHTPNPEMHDSRTKWELPFMYCSGPVGGYTTFDEAVREAIDAAMKEAK